MTKYFTKEQIMTVMGEQNLMLDDIWGIEQRLDELSTADITVPYCWKCGAKMDGGNRNDA